MVRPARFDRGPAARRNRWKRIWRSLRIILPLLLILAAWQVWNQPRLRAMLGLEQEASELVTGGFALCDAPGYASRCVVDGDTFRINNRRIRIQGIDAPEREGQCVAETQAAARATRALNDWLNEAPFHMLPEGTVPRDRYGRELQSVWRMDADGRRQDLARMLVRAGHAADYGRGGKPDWCR